MEIIITHHAKFEAARRNVSDELIKSVVENPQQELQTKKSRIIIQNKYYDKQEGKEMLLRVVGIKKAEHFKIITVYKTSRIEKYWKRGEQDEGNI